MAKWNKFLVILALLISFTTVHCDQIDEDDDTNQLEEKLGVPATVTYDGRSLLINGRRELLFSGSVHYPRIPPEHWGYILDRCKEGGLNVIQTYVFWNVHEPIKGQYNFTGGADIVKFIKMVADRGMWLTLRVGPFIQAEWTHGGLPVWLKDEKDIMFRSYNQPYMEFMEKWFRKITDLMKENKLYAPQGGPIIMSQVENEYDHVRQAFDKLGNKDDQYIQWAGNMAMGLNTGVPWIMCKQKDAPGAVINACNGRHCGDTFTGPNAPNKPALWTENWTAQFRVFGDPPSQRAAEDIAESVARWFSKNGTHINYYMYYGGTNYGRTAAAFVTTRYYDEAPIDEFGLERGPKHGHLRDVHRALVLCKRALFKGTYGVETFGPNLEARFYERGDLCSAFIWNNITHVPQTVKFRGNEFIIPPKSISILPDCKTVVHNTKQIVAQHSAREFVRSDTAHKNLKWEKTSERLPDKVGDFFANPQEQYKTTKDVSDYLWYSTSIDLDNIDLPFKKSLKPVIQFNCLGHALLAFVNGKFVGSGHGMKSEWAFPFQKAALLKEGVNNITVLSSTVGYCDSGSYQEKRMSGLRFAELQGLGTGNLDLTYNGWHHLAGLDGERLGLFTDEGGKQAKWSPAKGQGEPITWYRTYFDAPEGDEPLALRLVNMTKGLAWVNGKGIGRYWSSYRAVNDNPSQNEYHIPRAFLKPKDNLLVLFDEEGGDLDTVQIETVNRDVICSYIGEHMPAPIMSWKRKGDQILPVGDGKPQPTAQLRCPRGKIVDHVDFAGFAAPQKNGTCGLYFQQDCHSPNSQKVVEQHCLGKPGCDIPVDRNLFDNVCPELNPKYLAVQLRCRRKD